jgi:hypothetical protein
MGREKASRRIGHELQDPFAFVSPPHGTQVLRLH